MECSVKDRVYDIGVNWVRTPELYNHNQMKTIMHFIVDSNIKFFYKKLHFRVYYLNAETLNELADHKVFDICSEALFYQPSVS